MTFECSQMALFKILRAAFYRKPNGIEPVRAWLKLLTKRDRKIIGDDIREVECNWPVGMPKVKHIQTERMWEIRSTVTGNRNARIFFITEGKNMILLHGFFKNTQKIPKIELEMAQKYKSNMGPGRK